MKNVVRGIAVVAVLVAATSVWAHEEHEHGASAEHEHAGEQETAIDPSLLGFQGLQQVFNVHPVFVHFPIALFPSALLLYGLGIFLNWRSCCVAGRACLYLAAAGTIIAVVTGLMAQDTFPHNEHIHRMMQTHKSLGLLIGLISLVLAGWSFLHKAQRPKAAYPFLFALAFITYLALQNADLGGRMVFVEGAAVKPAVPVITGGHDAEHHHHHEPDSEDTLPQHTH